MTNTEIATQLDLFSQQLTAAAAEHNPERLSQVLEAQKEFVTANIDLLDDTSRKHIQAAVEHSLLLAKAARAHCLDAVQINHRKLGVLAAYRAG